MFPLSSRSYDTNFLALVGTSTPTTNTARKVRTVAQPQAAINTKLSAQPSAWDLSEENNILNISDDLYPLSPPHQQRQKREFFPFLRLPPELRNKIYALVLYHPTLQPLSTDPNKAADYRKYQKGHAWFPHTMGLLQANTQLRNEAKAMLVSGNTWKIPMFYAGGRSKFLRFLHEFLGGGNGLVGHLKKILITTEELRQKVRISALEKEDAEGGTGVEMQGEGVVRWRMKGASASVEMPVESSVEGFEGEVLEMVAEYGVTIEMWMRRLR